MEITTAHPRSRDPHSLHVSDINGALPCVPWLIFEIMSTFTVEAAVEVIMILRSAFSCSSHLPVLPDLSHSRSTRNICC